MATATLEQARAGISTRLRERREGIEAAVLARIYAVFGVDEVQNPEYAEGLEVAVSAALDYGIAAIELGEDRSPPVPQVLLAQARLAARNGIGLDTVLRRYFAGFALFADCTMQEAEEEADFVPGISLQRLLGTQAPQFDRLLAAIGEAHTHERESRFYVPEERRTEQVKRVLAGELRDATELSYELDGWHVGAIATGPQAADAIREVAESLSRRFLLVRPEADTAWAWLGGRQPFEPTELTRLASTRWPARVSIAIGEPGMGHPGWCLTHRQAGAALPIAQSADGDCIRYSEVALLASVLGDDLLSASLRELYLAPLEEARDGGEVLRETLRAYLRADHNVSSTAAALSVNRNTVANRLRAIEEKIGHSITACAAEFDTALRLEKFRASI